MVIANTLANHCKNNHTFLHSFFLETKKFCAAKQNVGKIRKLGCLSLSPCCAEQVVSSETGALDTSKAWLRLPECTVEILNILLLLPLKHGIIEWDGVVKVD